MLISLFPTPFDHFHFHMSGGLILWYDLRLWHKKYTVPPSIATQFRCRWREAPQDTACRRRRRLFNLFTGNWKRETIFTSNFPTFSPSYFHGKEEKIFSSHFCLESGLYKNMKPIKIIIQETNCGPPLKVKILASMKKSKWMQNRWRHCGVFPLKRSFFCTLR